MRNTPRGRRRWRPRKRKVPAPARPAEETAGQNGGIPSCPVQLAIGLLTASLDSAELEAWAAWALIPEDPEALCDVVAGLHIVNLRLLDLLHEATGQPPSATLQQLAISAEPGTPSA
jgi:hypothetical protein